MSFAPARVVAGLLGVAVLLGGCSGIKTYRGAGDKNLHVATVRDSDVRADLHVHWIVAPCKTEYLGSVELDRPHTEVAIAAGRPTLLVFTFASSSFWSNTRSAIRYDAVLTPAIGRRYLAEARYLDDIYNVDLREADGRLIEAQGLGRCDG